MSASYSNISNIDGFKHHFKILLTQFLEESPTNSEKSAKRALREELGKVKLAEVVIKGACKTILLQVLNEDKKITVSQTYYLLGLLEEYIEENIDSANRLYNLAAGRPITASSPETKTEEKPINQNTASASTTLEIKEIEIERYIRKIQIDLEKAVLDDDQKIVSNIIAEAKIKLSPVHFKRIPGFTLNDQSTNYHSLWQSVLHRGSEKSVDLFLQEFNNPKVEDITWVINRSTNFKIFKKLYDKLIKPSNPTVQIIKILDMCAFAIAKKSDNLYKAVIPLQGSRFTISPEIKARLKSEAKIKAIYKIILQAQGELSPVDPDIVELEKIIRFVINAHSSNADIRNFLMKDAYIKVITAHYEQEKRRVAYLQEHAPKELPRVTTGLIADYLFFPKVQDQSCSSFLIPNPDLPSPRSP